MSFVKNMFSKIKNIFSKKENIPSLQAYNDEIIQTNTNNKSTFINSLKDSTNTYKRKKVRIETLVCPGDGLGIQKKLKC